MPENPTVRSRIEGEGIPLVLLHAFPLDHRLWEGYRIDGYRLISVDFPGFGLSPLGPDGLSMESAAAGLRDHLDALGISEPVSLTGCSMGGYWAMEFARQFPERTAKLVLVSTRSGLDSPERKDKRLETANRVLRDGMGWYIDTMVESLLGVTTRKAASGLVQWVTRAVREADPKAVAAAQRAMASRRDQSEFMRACASPSRWYVGTEDPNLTVDEVKTMSQNSKRSGFETYRCGHLIPLEMAKTFVTSMYSFLRR
jgi:pimeloyl-ACP methyl ester carboxylesterase